MGKKVARMTQSTVSGATLAIARALPAAAWAMSARDSSGAAQCLVTMPVRDRIHSSDESMWRLASSLLTTRCSR